VGLGLRVWRGQRVILLPLFGAAIGAMGAGIYFAVLHLWGMDVARGATALTIKLDELLVATLWGALAFLPRERRSIGVAGAVTVAASIAIRWLAIDALVPGRTIEVFIAGKTVPRAAMVAIAWASRPSGEGAGFEFSSALRTPAALIAIAEGVAAALLCGLRPGLAILAGAYVIIRAVRWFSYRYGGGVNANSFGATQLLIEIFVLLLFTCGACRW
jgi:cobalamin synthase